MAFPTPEELLAQRFPKDPENYEGFRDRLFADFEKHFGFEKKNGDPKPKDDDPKNDPPKKKDNAPGSSHPLFKPLFGSKADPSS